MAPPCGPSVRPRAFWRRWPCRSASPRPPPDAGVHRRRRAAGVGVAALLPGTSGRDRDRRRGGRWRLTALDPDVVLLDSQMPGRSGVEVARALARRPRPEVVFVTAFSHWAAEAFELDAADYLLKPVRADRLEEAMNRARRRLTGSAT